MVWARGEPIGGSSHSGSQRIYGLSGMAGTSKSTIAHTIARACLDAGCLGASFFFSRGGDKRETVRTFVTSIAVQLARLLLQGPSRRALRAAICDAVREQPDIAQHALIDLWKQLMLRPCEKMRASSSAPPAAALALDAEPCAPPLVIVVDALDECHSADEIEFVLALLSQTSGLAVAELRIFLTSRPEILIREGLLDLPETRTGTSSSTKLIRLSSAKTFACFLSAAWPGLYATALCCPEWLISRSLSSLSKAPAACSSGHRRHAAS
jgi:hypothetical protein